MKMIYLLALLAIGQGSFLLVYLLTHKNRKQPSSLILSGIVLIEILVLYDDLMVNYQSNLPVHLYYWGSPLVILLGPLIYFYARSVTEVDFEFSRKHSLHLLPFLIMSIYILFNFQLMPLSSKELFIQNLRDLINAGVFESSRRTIVVNSTARLLILVYLLLGFRRTMLIDRKETTTSTSKKWPLYFVKFFFVSSIIYMGHIFFMGIWRFMFGTYYDLSLKTATLLFSSHLFGATFLYTNKPIHYFQQANKYAKSGLTEQDEQYHLKRLKKLLCNQQVYTDPLLSLSKLAGMLGINKHYLSQIINHGMGKTYNELINYYRVEHAKRLFSDPGLQHLSVEEIGCASGYIVPSSFYRAFKSIVGQTPAQFRSQAK